MKKRNLKRGAAIELSILILLIVTFAGALLVSASVIATKYKKDAFLSLTEKVRIEEGAESVLLHYLQGGDLSVWQEENEKFNDLDFRVNEERKEEKDFLILHVSKKADGNILLNAEFIKEQNGKLTIVRWDY